MTSRANILAWMDTNRASDNPRTGRRDVPECRHASSIWRRLNTSSHSSYIEGSDAEVQNFHPLFAEMFDQRDEGVNLIRLDSNLVHALVMDTCILG
jgi:hypothetical protein